MNKTEYYKQLRENKTYIEQVENDPYRLKFHLMPPSGWLNDPNGLCQFNNITHIYFQYSPFTTGWGMKLWGHYSTENYQEYVEYEPFLYPDIAEDKDGAYSGSAFVENDTIHYFYTGNVKYKDRDYNYDYEGREQNTIYFNSKDGIHHSKKTVILKNSDYPDFVGVHVRDPKVFKKDNVYYMILGARDKNDWGCALLYRSKDLVIWDYHMKIQTDTKFGYMWECPDLIEINNNWFLICSPQGIKQEGYRYANVHQVGYFKIDLDLKRKRYKLYPFYELDRGFDLYAPQTYLKDEQVVMYAWMGIPDAPYTNAPTLNYNWQHSLTMPRQLSVDGERIIQQPLGELMNLVADLNQYEVETILNLHYDKTLYLKFLPTTQFSINISKDIQIRFQNNLLSLKLKDSGFGRDARYLEIKQVNKLELFIDTSSIEIFVNDGKETFTSRIYPKTHQVLINGKGIVISGSIKEFTYKKVNYEEKYHDF